MLLLLRVTGWAHLVVVVGELVAAVAERPGRNPVSPDPPAALVTDRVGPAPIALLRCLTPHHVQNTHTHRKSLLPRLSLVGQLLLCMHAWPVNGLNGLTVGSSSLNVVVTGQAPLPPPTTPPSPRQGGVERVDSST